MLNSLVKPGSTRAFKLDTQKMEVSGSDTTFKKTKDQCWFNNSQVHLGVGGGAQIDTVSMTDIL